MKKAVALLLGLMLVLGFALVACGEAAEEETTTTVAEEVTTTEAASTAIPWADAGEYEGQEVTITGEVSAINDLWAEKGVAKVTIVFGDKAGDHFNIAISLNKADGTWPEYAAQYQGMLDALVGQTVEVTGVVGVNTWESCFEINLTDADGDTNPDAEPAGTMTVVQ